MMLTINYFQEYMNILQNEFLSVQVKLMFLSLNLFKHGAKQ